MVDCIRISSWQHRLLIVTMLLTLALFPSCGEDNDKGGNPTPVVAVKITTGGGYDPSPSPDGTRLAYRKPGEGVWVMTLTNGNSGQVFDGGYDVDWTNISDQVVVEYGGLMMLNVDSGDTMTFATGSNLEQPDWSPSGGKVVTHGTSPDGAYITNYPGGGTTRVNCTESGGSSCDGEYPTFSPDGLWIAFEDGLEIMKVAAAGGEDEVVVGGLNDVTEPSWSPDGKWIAFVMQDSTGNLTHIWVSDARGMSYGLKQETEGDFYDRMPAWSPNSRTLYFERRDTTMGGATDIWRIGFSAP